jgi:hypothetical protein
MMHDYPKPPFGSVRLCLLGNLLLRLLDLQSVRLVFDHTKGRDQHI